MEDKSQTTLPYFSESSGIVIILVSSVISLIAHFTTGVVVHPLLARRAVGHDGSVHPRSEHEAKGVVCAALGGNSSVMSESKSMSHFVPKTVVTKGAAFSDGSNCVTGSQSVEVVDPTNTRVGE